MSNFFAGIYRANDALTAARYGLDVTGQNIANANTPGYTRQASRQVAVGTAVGVPTIHSGTVSNGGVRATGADRLSDQVLNTRVRDEHAKSAQVDTQAARMSDVEDIFHEPSDTGLANQLQDFWNSWSNVANAPGAQVPREMVISSAQSTVTQLHAMDSSLDSVATASKNSLDATAESVNSSASELSDLNRKIAIGNASNADVNALLDRRDVLLDQMSSAIGAKATLNANGTASVTVGTSNVALVSVGYDQNGNPGGPPFHAGSLASGPTPWDPSQKVTLSITDAAGAVTPLVDSTTSTNLLTDSTVNAEVQALNTTIPGYRAKLDAVATSLADTVNAIQGGHTNTDPSTDPVPTTSPGYDLDGNVGGAMFSGSTAKDINVASGFGYKNVAAAKTQTAGGNVDGGNALTAAQSGSASWSPDTAYSSLVGDLGRASASAQQQQTTQGVITSSVDTLQSTTSGVSFDEEVSNMLTYQMAFQASSRVLTTLDSMLDTLINRTGIGG